MKRGNVKVTVIVALEFISLEKKFNENNDDESIHS